MNIRKIVRGLFLAGGLLVTAAVAAPSVHASPAEPAAGTPNPGLISWSVIPAGATAPDSRTLYQYQNIPPGASISDHVAVLNRSARSVAFSIYLTDASGTTASGALTLLQANQKSTDIGAWTTFGGSAAELNVVIPGGKGVIEPFTIKVPRLATPGDHTGGMVASVGVPERNAAGQLVTLYQRIAVPVEMRITGPLHAGLRVESVSVGLGNPVNPFGGGGATVTYSVVNTGNVKLSASQVVAVTGAVAGSATRRPPLLPLVLPGDSVRVTVSAGGLYPIGPVDAHVSVTPQWPRNTTPFATQLTLASGAASLFAVPYALLVLLVLLAGGGYGGWRWRRWRRRQHEADVAGAAERARRETEQRLLGSSNGKSAAAAAPDTADTGSEPRA